MRLEGKVALVAGAAGPANMGQKIAERLAQEGCKVVVTGRHEEPLRAIAEQIGGNYILMDITSKADVDAAADFAVKTYGKLDIGVNATGWGLMKPTHETTEADLDKIMGIIRNAA